MTAGRSRQLVLLAVVLVSLNMRGSIAAVPPLIDEIAGDLGITRAGASLLTSLPVLCFAVGAPVAALLGRRHGAGRAVLVGLALIAVGTAGRVLGGSSVLFLGTAVLGLGITIANILVPSVIKEVFGVGAGRVTGYFVATMAVGAALTSALAVPLAGWLGWRGALAFWTLLVPLAMFGWWRHVTRPGRAASDTGGEATHTEDGAATRTEDGAATRTEDGAATHTAGGAATHTAGGAATHTEDVAVATPAHRDGFVWRLPLAWALAIALGTQSALYYSLTTWLPSILVDQAEVSAGVAGAALSVYQLTAIPTALTIAGLCRLRRNQGWIGATIAGGWVVCLLGLMLAPALWPLWTVIGGPAQGAGFTYVLTLIVLRSGDEHVVRALGGMGQLLGYSIGAAGPVAVGWLAQTTGGWAAPVALLLGLAVVLGAMSLVAGRDHTIGVPAAAR